MAEGWTEAAVPEVLSSLTPLATAKKIELKSAIECDLRVSADPLRVKQVLYNLKYFQALEMSSCKKVGNKKNKN